MTTALDPSLLAPGFRHLVLDSQATFRVALDAMSRPGKVANVSAILDAPAPLKVATAALALALLDADTPVWLDPAADVPAVQAYLRFHCGCPLVQAPRAAAFALVADGAALPGLEAFEPGDEQYPDQSCSVVVQLPDLHGGPAAMLSGPGIKQIQRIAPAGLPLDFAARWSANNALYPLGVDLFLTSGAQVMGLPRTARWSA